MGIQSEMLLCALAWRGGNQALVSGNWKQSKTRGEVWKRSKNNREVMTGRRRDVDQPWAQGEMGMKPGNRLKWEIGPEQRGGCQGPGRERGIDEARA